MNKIIVVVGGTSGIGKNVSNLLKKDGNTVICIGRNPTDPTQYKVDITMEQEIENFFSIIKDKYGKIDILINSAGYGISGAAELSSFTEVKNLFDVNYFGAFRIIKYALPIMNKNSKIINISSCCALFPLPFRIHYCASKSALSSLSYGLRMELEGTGIQVSTINPGDVMTNFIYTRKKDFSTNSRYGMRVGNAQVLIDKNNKKRMSVEYVSKKIFNIINKEKVKAMYIIGTKYKIFNFFSKLIPINVFLKIINKFFGGGKIYQL